jgi:predicted phage terminase large subunit-like protein
MSQTITTNLADVRQAHETVVRTVFAEVEVPEDFSPDPVAVRIDDNYLYVLKVDVRRRTPDKIIDDIIEGAIEYQHLLQSVSVETVQFQQMFADTLKDKCLAAGLAIDWDEVKPFGEKNNRIRGLIPKVKNGYVLFHPTQVALINEMRRFPKGRDDALDTLQMVVKVALPAVSGFVFGCIDYSGRSKPNEIYRQNL